MRTAGSVLDAIRDITPVLESQGPEMEAAGRLSPEVVAALAGAGLFRLCVPAAFGGSEADVPTLLRALEQVSAADGAAGWVAMIAATTGLCAGFMQPEGAREVWADPDVVTGGMVTPKGRATRVGGGYRVDGTWTFGSGSLHAAWMLGGCAVEGGPPVLMAFEVSDVHVHDTWHVSGLKATGSHDWSVEDAFVPDHRVARLFGGPAQPGPLYRFPPITLLALGISAVGLGIARRAIDELVGFASGKTPAWSSRSLAERPAAQAAVARAESALGAARAYLYETSSSAWSRAAEGEVGIPERTALRMAARHAVVSCVQAVDLMYDAGGGTAIYERSPLQRCFRDVHTVTAHLMVSQSVEELTGRLLLGLETDTAML